MREQLVQAVFLAIQYVVFVRVVRPWIVRQFSAIAELIALVGNLIPSTR